MEELHDFYTKYEGKSWKVTEKKYCWSGRMMVAPYKSEGYHRVMVRRMMKNDMVSVLFVDFGTIDKSLPDASASPCSSPKIKQHLKISAVKTLQDISTALDGTGQINRYGYTEICVTC